MFKKYRYTPGAALDLCIQGFSPGCFGNSPGYNCLMKKRAPEVFMWLHIKRPAAKNATLSPAQIVEADLASCGICPYCWNNLLQIQHQCYSFPLYVSLILPEPIY